MKLQDFLDKWTINGSGGFDDEPRRNITAEKARTFANDIFRVIHREIESSELNNSEDLRFGCTITNAPPFTEPMKNFSGIQRGYDHTSEDFYVRFWNRGELVLDINNYDIAIKGNSTKFLYQTLPSFTGMGDNEIIAKGHLDFQNIGGLPANNTQLVNYINSTISASIPTFPSLGRILFVSETGSTTQSRLYGLGRIDKPFKLQRALDVALQDDIIIIYDANDYTNYSVGKSGLIIFTYTALNIDFNNTSYHQIYCYASKSANPTFFIKNLQESKLNVYFNANLYLINCNNLNLISEQLCYIFAQTSLSNCTFKSNIRSWFYIYGSAATKNFSNLNIENFNIATNVTKIVTFTNCIFNKSNFSPTLGRDSSTTSSIINCSFYDSIVDIKFSEFSAQLNFQNNRFVRCLIDFTLLNLSAILNGFAFINKFIDCILKRNNIGVIRIDNSTWILKNCIIHNPNILNTLPYIGFFRLDTNCNLYLIDCKYEVPTSTPYGISNNFAGELQLINCQLPTAITDGKIPTVSSNVFTGSLPDLNDVLNNI